MSDSFLKELLGRFLLLQLMDFLSEPDTINLLLLLLLNPNHMQQHQQRFERQQHQLILPSQQIQQPQQQVSGESSKLSSTLSHHDQDSEAKMATDGSNSRDTAALLRSQHELLEPVLLLNNFASVNTHPRNSVRSG